VGEEMKNPFQGNAQVMIFAGSFLEPDWLIPSNEKAVTTMKLPQPNLQDMCSLLTSVSKDAVSMYSLEGGVAGLAYMRLESLLRLVMAVLDNHETNSVRFGKENNLNAMLLRKKFVEEESCFRKVLASITGDMTKLAEKLLLIVQDDAQNGPAESSSKSKRTESIQDKPYYVRLVLSGTKPKRFQESTTLPTFLEWNTPCICRVPKDIVQQTLSSVPKESSRLETVMCTRFCRLIRDGLLQEDVDGSNLVAFRVGGGGSTETVNNGSSSSATTIDVGFVYGDSSSSTSSYSIVDDADDNTGGLFYNESRHFRYYKSSTTRNDGTSTTTSFVEMTVANTFPCPLSRQKSVLTNEFIKSPK
jgi:hypothetical protein